MLVAITFIIVSFAIVINLFLSPYPTHFMILIFFVYPIVIRLRWLYKTFLTIRDLEEIFKINEDEILSQLTDDKHPVYNASTGEWVHGYVPTKKTGPYITKDWMICLSEKPWLVKLTDIKSVKQERDTTVRFPLDINIGIYNPRITRRGLKEAITRITLLDGTVQMTSISTLNLNAAVKLITAANPEVSYENNKK